MSFWDSITSTISNIWESDQKDRKEFEKDKENFLKNHPEYVKGGGLILDPISSLNPKNIAISKGLETAENLVKGRFQYHGNWAGPNYSAGRYFEKGEIITKDDILSSPPVDKLDALTLLHDLRYQLAATKPSQSQRKEALRYADKQFIEEAEKLLDSQDIPTEERVKTNAAVVAFKAKLTSDIGYNIDRLQNWEEAKNVVLDYFNQVDPNDIPKEYDKFRQEELLKDNLEVDELENDIVEDEIEKVENEKIEGDAEIVKEEKVNTQPQDRIKMLIAQLESGDVNDDVIYQTALEFLF